MYSDKMICHDKFDLKFQWGNLVINVLYLSYQPPSPTWKVNMHAHSSYEFHFIPAGRGTLRIDQDTYKIVPGIFYLTGPEIYHQQETDPVDPMCEFSLNFELIQGKPSRHKLNPFIQSDVDQLFRIFNLHPFWFGSDTQQLTEDCKQLLDELNSTKLGCYSTVQNIVSQIIIKAARIMSDFPTPNYALPRKIVDDRRRTIVDDFFRNPTHFSKSPALLAKRIGVGVRQLNRIMIAYYGMTFIEKWKHHRIEYAKLLLISTDWPVKKIVDEIGYSDPGYFHKVFKDAVQLTPREYKGKFGR